MTGRLDAYIGLGANVGDARAALERAVAALAALPDVLVGGISRLYRTRPVGLAEQPDFHNAVVELRVPAGATPEEGAMALLMALKQIERALGRRDRQRWGPREIDLDLLLFGTHRVYVERTMAARSERPDPATPQWLEVPHPLARERLFVLAPLADVAPELEPPGWGMSVSRAASLARAREGRGAVDPVGAWDGTSGGWVSRPHGAPLSDGSGDAP